MSHRHEQAARNIALDMLRGAQVKAVGAKSLHGLSPSYVEVDGAPVAWPLPAGKEAPGVRTTLPDGYTALYLTTTQDRALYLLRQARQIAEEHHERWRVVLSRTVA